MKCVDVGSVEPGMVLAQPVYNHQGDLMFDVGSAITDKDVRVLKSWGVEKVWVEKDNKDNVAGTKTDIEDKTAETFNSDTLEDKFRDVLDDPVMAEIMRVAKKIQERRYSKLQWNDDNRQSNTNH